MIDMRHIYMHTTL